ncbi:MAG: galactokinase, partial [Bacteroidales bacterium]|nr:galactokinase [Bacteroidales bacterium]
GCPELKTLYEAMTRTEGLYGGRFSGAGFKGCCIALVDPDREESVLREVGDAYLNAYSALRGKYQAIVARNADGWLAMNES